MKLKDFKNGGNTICQCGKDEFEELNKDLWLCTWCHLVYAYMKKNKEVTDGS